MRKIKLIDMPFTLPECPAFGLTQLKSYANKHFGNEFQTEILYLTHDFYVFMGEEFYKQVNADFFDFYKFSKNKNMWVDDLEKSGLEVAYFNGGLGDWIFRALAFPDEADNTEEYFANVRFKDEEFKKYILSKRNELDQYLDTLIAHYHIDDADMVGFTSRFQQQVAALALARKIKKLNPKVITFIGGPNCEPPAGAELAKHLNMIDYVLSGRRFLKGFGQILAYIADDCHEKIEAIPGVYACGIQNKKVEINQLKKSGYEMGEEDDISDFIELDYDSYFLSLQNKKLDTIIEPVLFFETSRGCEWGEKSRCKFCAIDGYNPTYRVMNKEQAIKYFETIFKYADRCKYFIGTDSCFPKYYLTEVFPYVKVPENINILYEVRVNYTEREIKMLAMNKINLLIAGIESLSNQALKLLNKGTTVFDNIKFLKRCRKYNLSINWNILVGIPGETNEMIEKNASVIPYIYHFYPPTGVWLVSYQGNCEYNEASEEYGIKLAPLTNAHKYAYPFSKESLDKMTYFKDLENKKEVFNSKKARSIQRVSYVANIWKGKWRTSDKNALPDIKLKETEDGAIIIDSRDVKSVEYKITKLALELLKLLNDNEIGIKVIYQKIYEHSSHNIDDILAELLEKKLLYCENDTYVSLVVI